MGTRISSPLSLSLWLIQRAGVSSYRFVRFLVTSCTLLSTDGILHSPHHCWVFCFSVSPPSSFLFTWWISLDLHLFPQSQMWLNHNKHSWHIERLISSCVWIVSFGSLISFKWILCIYLVDTWICNLRESDLGLSALTWSVIPCRVLASVFQFPPRSLLLCDTIFRQSKYCLPVVMKLLFFLVSNFNWTVTWVRHFSAL